MKKLIEALTIFSKYTDTPFPTHCEHDVLYVNVQPEDVSDQDKVHLDELGFFPSSELDMFMSYRFGSC